MTTDRRVLFFGDSFVAGVGDPTGLGWVGRVVAASHEARLPLTAYNLGVRGDTARDVGARWRAEAQARMRAVDASYGVVLSMGVNDMVGVELHPRAVSLSAILLARLIDETRGLGLDVYVVGPPPIGEHEPDERIRELSARFADLTAHADVPFVDTFGPLGAAGIWTSEAAANDGSHPGAGGYAALAELVLGGGWMAWLEGLAP